MTGALHPSGNALLRDVFQRVPRVGLLCATGSDTAVTIPLVEVFRETLRKVTSEVFPARVAGAVSAIGRIFSVRIYMTEEVSPGHIGAVRSSDARQLFIEPKGGQLPRLPFIVNKVVNATFQRRYVDFGLPRLLSC